MDEHKVEIKIAGKNVNFHSSPKEGQCQKMLKYCAIALISHTGKVMLKILQARFQ